MAELSLLIRQKQLPSAWIDSFEEKLALLFAGESVQYVIGQAWFWGLPLKVNSQVLIPRPETEQLVELALKYIFADAWVLDCCTGSGAIALALKSNLPQASVHASDISAPALSVAKENALELGLEVEFHHCDLFPDTQIRYNLIISNPPYVSQAEYESLEPVVKDNEPQLALLSGIEGLDQIKRILSHASLHLHKKGYLILEHGSEQGQKIIEYALKLGWELELAAKDLCDRDRFLVFKQKI